jgi:hypothetical protein
VGLLRKDFERERGVLSCGNAAPRRVFEAEHVGVGAEVGALLPGELDSKCGRLGDKCKEPGEIAFVLLARSPSSRCRARLDDDRPCQGGYG